MSDLEVHFENLKGTNYAITSPFEPTYNCIAFAAGQTHTWWWPIGPYYWPPPVTRAEPLQSFILAFRIIGYFECADGSLESDFEKVAIYVGSDGAPTHMARQLPSGQWTSKCGKSEDIVHETLDALTGTLYGAVA